MRLAATASVVPTETLAVEDCVTAAGHPPVEARAFRRIFGIDEVRVWPRDKGFAEILRGLLDDLEDSGAAPPDTFIYVHACPLHAVAAKAVLQSPRGVHPFLAQVGQVCEMDQNCCATLFWALDAARNMLRRGTARSILVVAGESFSDMTAADRYMPACTVLGDAYTAMVVDGGAGGLRVSDIVLRSNPEFHFGLYATDAEVHAFNRAQVRLTADVLDGMKFRPNGGEPILPHNINRFIWDQYCAASGTPRGQVWLGLLAGHGHCCSTDAFLGIDRFLGADDIRTAVLVGVGQGGFVGGCRVSKPDRRGANAAG
jgi:3-oxoacyl-[acyl-carrier-protein] synthase III